MRGRSARQENTASLSRRRVPGWPVFPALRMLRVVAGALALAMVLSLVLQAQAARRLTALVDTSWRGSFDLIVSAPGATLAVADVAAPLDTAAWTSSADRLSVGDLDRIRAESRRLHSGTSGPGAVHGRRAPHDREWPPREDTVDRPT